MCTPHGVCVGVREQRVGSTVCVQELSRVIRPAQPCPLSCLTSPGNRSPWHLGTLEADCVRSTLCGFPDGHQVGVFFQRSTDSCCDLVDHSVGNPTGLWLISCRAELPLKSSWLPPVTHQSPPVNYFCSEQPESLLLCTVTF